MIEWIEDARNERAGIEDAGSWVLEAVGPELAAAGLRAVLQSCGCRFCIGLAR
jgi:hypothetical protein